jgi:integrase
LTVSEQQQLQSCLEGEWLRMAILLDLYTGMRQGELLGLMWKDVHLDADAPYLRVTQTLNRLKNYGDNVGKKTLLEIGIPKTGHSIRNIPLLPYIVNELKAYRQAQTDYLKERGIAANGYVFMNREGNWIDPRDFQRGFKCILKKNAIREINVHGLRHTFATRALESGMSPKTLSKILGHSSVGFTLDVYAHVSDALMHDEMANLEGFL